MNIGYVVDNSYGVSNGYNDKLLFGYGGYIRSSINVLRNNEIYSTVLLLKGALMGMMNGICHRGCFSIIGFLHEVPISTPGPWQATSALTIW